MYNISILNSQSPFFPIPRNIRKERIKIKQVLLICVQSRRQEVRQFYAGAGYAVFLGLSKTTLLCHSDIQYQFFCCNPLDNIRGQSVLADCCIFYFLCSTMETEDFFSVNFRNISHGLYLLNSNRYCTERDISHFQILYRLPACSIYAVSFNLAFQASISNNQANRFFYFYKKKRLCNQNCEFLEQLQKIHLLAVAHTKGEF